MQERFDIYNNSEKAASIQESTFSRFVREHYFNAQSMFDSVTRENSSSYFCFGDMQHNVFYISDNMRQEFGFESNIVPDLIRVWEERIPSAKHLRLYREDIQSMICSKRTAHDLRYQVRKSNGETIWVRCYGMLEWNEEKTMPLFFSARITHQDDQFVVDPVTNLPRMLAAFTHLREVQCSGKSQLVIAFSLNSITEINNTRGRPCSDRLLRNISSTLMDRLFDRMAFYHFEGMRCMAVVDPECTESPSELIAEIRAIIEECCHEMEIPVHSFCSFAVMRYPCDNLSPEDFMGHIISLIRLAKSTPDKPYIEYSAESVGRIQKMSKIALALNQDVLNGMQHFRIVVQPIVNAQNGTVIGGEVLLRWTFEGENISPGVFIPMLEKSEMIHTVGLWVFDQAAQNCMKLLRYDPSFYLTFNISLRQFSNPDFAASLIDVVAEYGLDASHLTAEITESCLDSLPESLARFAAMCSSIGMRIALDDFGSGYSSMRMLLRYPYDIIKLDRSLLGEIMESDQKMQFIRSIVYACHQFGKKVCMEGVETEEQNNLIRQTGCDMIQGFYYYRPMELCDLYRLLSRGDQYPGSNL